MQKYEISQEELSKLDKDQLVKIKDYAFENMLPKETNQLNQMKILYGYFNNKILNDFTRVRNFTAEKHKDQFIHVSEIFTEITTNVS